MGGKNSRPKLQHRLSIRDSAISAVCEWHPTKNFLAVGDALHDLTASDTEILSKCNTDAKDLAWSPDGSVFLRATSTGHLVLQDLDGKASDAFGRERQEVTALGWSSSGDKILALETQGTATLWRPDGTLIRKLKPPRDHTYTCFSWRDRTVLAIGCDNFRIVVYDINNQSIPIATLKGHTDSVTTCAWGAKNTLASGSKDKSVLLWGFEGDHGHLIGNLQQKAIITGLQWSKGDQNSFLIVGDESGIVKVWDTEQGTCLQTLSRWADANLGTPEPIADLALSPDNSFVACCAWDAVDLWSVATGDLVTTFDITGSARARWNSAGDKLALSDYEGNVHIKEMRSLF